MPAFRHGNWVKVIGGNYSYTRPDSFGIVMTSGDDYTRVFFLHINTPDQSYFQETTLETLDRLIFMIGTDHLVRMLSEDVEDNFEYFEQLEDRYDIMLGEFLADLAENPNLAIHNRRDETIPQVIKRLHKRQTFYKEHHAELPAWTASYSD